MDLTQMVNPPKKSRYEAKPKEVVREENSEEESEESAVVRREDQFGKRKRDIGISFQGLSSKVLPPVQKKRVAVYEVMGVTDDEGNPIIDPTTKLPVDPAPLILPGVYVFEDIFEQDPMKRHKYLRNVQGTEVVIENGKPITKERVDSIEFVMSNGQLHVNIESDYVTYTLLELHPLNATGKYRDRSMAPAFRRIDTVRRWDKTILGMDLAYDAEKTIMEERDGDRIITMAHAAGIPTRGRALDGNAGVKFDLRVFARQNPKEFFMLNKDNDMAVKIAVADSLHLGLIEYNADKRAWYFSTDGERAGWHTPGVEPEEALIKFYRSEDGQALYEKLQDQLNYFD